MRVFVAAATLAAAIVTSLSAPAAASATSTYQSLPAPGRVLDTRSGASTIDGTAAGVGAIRPGETLQLRVGGRAGVPADAVSVVLNVTVTEPIAPGYVTVHACGTDRPNASNLNFVTGQTVANFVVARLGSDAGVCLYSFATTHLIVDVAGYFTSSDALSPLDAPGRLLDSRPGAGTLDGVSAGIGLVSGATEVRLQVGGRAGVPSDATSAVLNVTVTEPRADGFVTVYPCDSGRPTASNLNYVSGQTVPNAVLTKLSVDGTVCLYSLASTHLIADVSAYSRSVDVIVPLARPARLMDTRPGLPTIDGIAMGTGLRPLGGTVRLQVTGRAGIPSTASAAILNVTATETVAPGYVTVYPAGREKPLASNLNFGAKQTVPNTVVAAIGTDGGICLFNFAATHLIVDIAGYVAGSEPAPTGATCPSDPYVPPPPPPPPTIVTRAPGQYFVNQTMPPGRYVANATSGCYWERLSGLGGGLDDILANDFRSFAGPVIVDVLPTDLAFKFDGQCGTMRTYTAPAAPAGSIAPGSHVVGSDILPGTYTANAASGCYWSRLRGFTEESSDLIANDFISTAGPVLVTISAGDVGFYSDADCGTWTPA